MDRARTTSTIRPDFRRKTAWTAAEAAEEAGVKPGTVLKWLSMGKVKRAYLVGPYSVDAADLLRFLREGE